MSNIVFFTNWLAVLGNAFTTVIRVYYAVYTHFFTVYDCTAWCTNVTVCT